MTDFKVVQLTEIHPDPNQPRKFFDDTAMAELTQSVKEKGVLQPILIRPNGKGYILVCGERRYRASEAAGLSQIPAVIRKLTDDEALELQIIENLQRKDVHPMEEAVAFRSLMEGKQWTIQEVAARVGKKDFFVKQRLKLNELITEWQQLFYKNSFTLTEALQLCLLPESAQREFFKNEANNGSNIRIDSYRLSQYKGDLHKATFDLSDSTLDKKMGPCKSCQYNTAVSLLFPEHADSPRCMNVRCFKNKSEVFFNRELAKSKEDPTIIFISTNGYQYGNTKLVAKLKSDGLQVLRQYQDYNEINRPEKPDWEEYKDDNYYEEEGHDLNEVRQDYEKEVADYDKQIIVFEKKIATARYKKALVVDGGETGRYVFIDLKEKGGQKASKEAVESGDANAEDIDSEISRIKEREVRAKELDAEKVHSIVKEILSKSKSFTAEKRDCNLQQVEITAAVIALFESGSFELRRWMKKNYELQSDYGLDPKDYKKLSGLNEFGMNEVLWHFIADKLIGNGLSPVVSASALAVHNIAKHYHSFEVEKAVSDQEAVALRRIDRVDKRIAELQEKKKELAAIAKPEKKAKAKKTA